MARPYSTLFFAGGISATTPTPLYTVPAGFIAVLRDIDALAVSVPSGFLQVYRFTDTVTVYYVDGGSATASVQWRGRQVFEAGEVMTAYGTASAWHLNLSGYLLTA